MNSDNQEIEERLAAHQVQSGFRLLADLTELESMDVSCVPHIENIIKLCNQKGDQSGADYSRSQTRHWTSDHVLFPLRGDVDIVTCENFSDAMKALSSPKIG